MIYLRGRYFLMCYPVLYLAHRDYSGFFLYHAISLLDETHFCTEDCDSILHLSNAVYPLLLLNAYAPLSGFKI